jgi:hypothetical protein
MKFVDVVDAKREADENPAVKALVRICDRAKLSEKRPISDSEAASFVHFVTMTERRRS